MLNTNLFALFQRIGLGTFNPLQALLSKAGVPKLGKPGRIAFMDRRPLGQREGDGWYPSQGPQRANLFDLDPEADATQVKLKLGWVDNQGLPHGRSGAKLARKARRGQIGVCHGKRKA